MCAGPVRRGRAGPAAGGAEHADGAPPGAALRLPEQAQRRTGAAGAARGRTALDAGRPERARGRGFTELLAQERAHRFDLGRPPLLRATLARIGEREWKLLLNFHHILLDGWSLSVLLAELMTCYQHGGGALPPAPAIGTTWSGWPDRTGPQPAPPGARRSPDCPSRPWSPRAPPPPGPGCPSGRS
ncbi:hypothetical protein GXW82_13985 [Streptacidiphilus sp. 4-A2]|nr:hypothetical protein [Streptacidiphilus sp. 4-A2]